MTAETFEFQVEARQLLQLVIHSIYSNKDVFLRELVSNASDALDKLRIEALRDSGLGADVSDLHIEIETGTADEGARTLTVRDNGIGMSRDEVVELIGTIARSGTAAFLKQLKEAKEAKDTAATEELIGQFGVGFYSSFMVADEVTLVTRRAGESEGTRWTSDGEGSYTIDTVADAPQGTSVTLRLKPEDADDKLYDYTSQWKIREVVKRYSDFITWPIRLVTAQPAAPAAPSATEESADADSAQEEQTDAAETAAPAEPETINSRKALWARPREEVTDDEYHELYKHISHDWNDPLETIRLQAEGTFEYQALLFVPSRAPHDLYTREYRRGLQLYVKRVFIMDDCEELLPSYLRFVKGVVDAQDLSLNVSREILQQDRQIQLMHRRLTKKVLSTIKDMMTGAPDRYAALWSEFGQVVKEGLLSDRENQDAILAISSFATTHSDEPTTLAQYVARMPEGQEHIYYLAGETKQALEDSPHMEAFRAKGVEVLLLTDPVDEVWVTTVPDFQGKQLRSVAKGEIELGTEEERKQAETEREERQDAFADLLAWMSGLLSDQVKEVRLSSRLTVSPACIVSDTDDITPALEQIYQAMGQEVPHGKRILELNPGHALVTGLRQAHADRADDPALAETAELLHGLALLAEGGRPADPSRFVKLMAKQLEHAL